MYSDKQCLVDDEVCGGNNRTFLISGSIDKVCTEYCDDYQNYAE